MDDAGDFYGDCDPIGDPVFLDLDGKKFYSGVVVHNLTVKLGDCARINIDASNQDERADDDPSIGYAQILAIYEDPKWEEIFVEARWFFKPREIYHDCSKRKRVKLDLKEDELIESDIVEDIPAGSMAELIVFANDNSKSSTRSKASRFICRYLKSSDSDTLQFVSLENILQRGMASSEFKHCYMSYLESMTGSKSRMKFDKFSKAIQQLHVSVVPTSLPCRELERASTETQLRQAVQNGHGPPFYISGMPGTGKTATILSVVKALQKETEEGKLAPFEFVEINCLRLQTPSDAYALLWRALSGEQLSPAAAKNRVVSYLSETSRSRTGPSVLICLLDEIDALITRDEKVLYQFFDWVLMKTGLIVIGISNVLNLPEKLSTRVKSRFATLIRIQFKPYTHEEIRIILRQRLDDFESPIFQGSALELLSRKASTVAGDLRAALKMCQRAIEMFRDSQDSLKAAGGAAAAGEARKGADKRAVAETEIDKISFGVVNAAVDEYKKDPFRSSIERVCQLDKAILVCVCRHIRASAESTLSLQALWERLEDLIQQIYSRRRSGPGGDRLSAATAGGSGGVGSVGSLAATFSRGSTQLGSGSGPRRVGAATISLLLPPFPIFEEAVQRLVDQGLLKKVSSRFGEALPRLSVLSLRTEVADVYAALKQDPFGELLTERQE